MVREPARRCARFRACLNYGAPSASGSCKPAPQERDSGGEDRMSPDRLAIDRRRMAGDVKNQRKFTLTRKPAIAIIAGFVVI